MKAKIYIDKKNNINKMDEFNKICRKTPVIIRPMTDADFKEVDSYISGAVNFKDLNTEVKDYIIVNSIVPKTRA
ncbi:MAG: hypothetical protein IJ638_03510 [Alphaproteobacteria bacterium]|nr:hypothetical protein [Alphaproteobacteria bacterium]